MEPTIKIFLTLRKQKIRKLILDSVAGDIELRSKRELIEMFIQEHLPLVDSAVEIPDSFEEFWEQQRVSAFERLCNEEKLVADRLSKVIDRFVYTGKEPLPDPDIIELINRPLRLSDRKPTRERVHRKVVDYVTTYIYGVAV